MVSRPPIAVHEYIMSSDATDGRHAISVTNLTKAECREIAGYVQMMMSARPLTAARDDLSRLTGSWKPPPPPNEEMAALDYAAYERERYAAYEREQRQSDPSGGRGVSIARTVREADERQRAMYLAAMMQDMSGDDVMEEAVRDAARQPEPTDADAAEEPPNRFSGLDFE